MQIFKAKIMKEKYFISFESLEPVNLSLKFVSKNKNIALAHFNIHSILRILIILRKIRHFQNVINIFSPK